MFFPNNKNHAQKEEEEEKKREKTHHTLQHQFTNHPGYTRRFSPKNMQKKKKKEQTKNHSNISLLFVQVFPQL